MPDLGETLAAEAARQQPTRQPVFADLARRRRARDWRYRAAAGLLTIAVGAGVGGLVQLWNAHPGPFEPAAPSSPAESGPQRSDVGASVSGSLRLTGGQRGATPLGVNGTVEFRAADGRTTSVTTASDGTFTVRLEPGSYDVTGRSPSFGNNQYVCRTDAPIAVPAGGLGDVLVACSRR